MLIDKRAVVLPGELDTRVARAISHRYDLAIRRAIATFIYEDH